MNRLLFQRTFSAAALLLAAPVFLTGCGLGSSALTGGPGSPAPRAGSITGSLHGGQQPVSGAHIYLFAAGTTGYTSANTSLLMPGTNGVLSDSVGGYVASGSDGSFSLSGDYNCPATANTPVYLLALGGNPGAGVNANLALLAALGSCDTLKANAATTFISINEATTVAAAYALAPFVNNSGTSAGFGFSTSASNTAGLSRAFSTAANLADTTSGTMRAKTPDGGGTVPQSELNSLADSLQSCINSNGGAAPSGVSDGSLCGDLFAATTMSGVAPTNTITAMLSVVQHPDHNAARIFSLAPAVGAVFMPQLTVAPADWTVAVSYKGGGLTTPQMVAIDGNGNAWVANQSNVLTEVTTAGFATGANGKTLSTVDAPVSLAVDVNGNLWISNCGMTCSGSSHASSLTYFQTASSTESNFTSGGLNTNYPVAVTGSNLAWTANTYASSLTLISKSGAVSSGSSGYTNANLQYPVDIAADSSNNVWAVSPSLNSLTVLNTSGSIQTASYIGSGLNYPTALALDGSNRAWVTNTGSNSVAVISAGNPIGGSPFTEGGLVQPNAIAIDGAGNAWVANSGATITELASSGTALSANGFRSAALSYANGIAVDPSGNVWVTNCGSYCSGSGTDAGSLLEFVGAGSPTMTPLASAALANKIAAKP